MQAWSNCLWVCHPWHLWHQRRTQSIARRWPQEMCFAFFSYIDHVKWRFSMTTHTNDELGPSIVHFDYPCLSYSDVICLHFENFQKNKKKYFCMWQHYFQTHTQNKHIHTNVSRQTAKNREITGGSLNIVPEMRTVRNNLEKTKRQMPYSVCSIWVFLKLGQNPGGGSWPISNGSPLISTCPWFLID